MEGDGRVVDVACVVEPGKRRFERNGKRCHASDMPQTLMSVLFNPDDLSFVSSARLLPPRGASTASVGRPTAGTQSLSAYGRAVEQRNRPLKDDHPDLSLLDAWDASVALGGASSRRGSGSSERLRGHISAICRQISDGERLECSYQCSLAQTSSGSPRDQIADVFPVPPPARAQELRRRQTLVGPQRDTSPSPSTAATRAFGLQGQQRSIVLAWKMAEVELAREVVGEPLLLLDDVMSAGARRPSAREHDALRAIGIQTVVTTTNLGYFPDDLLEGAKVVEIGGGKPALPPGSGPTPSRWPGRRPSTSGAIRRRTSRRSSTR